MTRKLEARAVELLRQLAASFTEDPAEPIDGADAVDTIVDFLAEVRPLLQELNATGPDKMLEFVEQIARMKTEDEFGEDQPFSEDWICTLNDLIESARELVGAPRQYPRENKCSVCDAHIGWIMHEDGELVALDKCDDCVEAEESAFDLARDTALHPAISKVVDVCLAGAPAINGVCGDPDCVCAKPDLDTETYDAMNTPPRSKP